ncbi:hypothetical protein OIU74_021144 [Salix koriyanagi]|uniref:Uncharacterized protein n=1 Tax=Salix koriyanagi TaxID=2511006 RepID=A0A9Q0P7G8_9ROSI|nr:hypothetical protein OIU74_021144 [Salix koriyanagi]
MNKEKLKWDASSSIPVDFLIKEVMATKAGKTLDSELEQDEKAECRHCLRCSKPWELHSTSSSVCDIEPTPSFLG